MSTYGLSLKKGGKSGSGLTVGTGSKEKGSGTSTPTKTPGTPSAEKDGQAPGSVVRTASCNGDKEGTVMQCLFYLIGTTPQRGDVPIH
jgi:hypothetical protein